jgi:hypothetical protein
MNTNYGSMNTDERRRKRLVLATRIALRRGWWLGWIAAAFFLALLTIERRGHENTCAELTKAWHTLEERGAK